jgi:hypothetical protein
MIEEYIDASECSSVEEAANANQRAGLEEVGLEALKS